MPIEIIKAGFPSPPRKLKQGSARTVEELERRLLDQESLTRALLAELNNLGFVRSESIESTLATADEIIQEVNANGTLTFDADTTVADVTASSPQATSWLTDEGALATEDSIDWDSGGTSVASGLLTIPDHFVDAIPSSGSGLQVTAEGMGYYKSGHRLNVSDPSGFVIGEIVEQLVTGPSKGIVWKTEGVYLYVTTLTGSWSGGGAGDPIVGQTSGTSKTKTGAATASTSFGMFIGASGDFYFAGDDDNYISWDGTNINIVCAGGIIGSSTDFFDITNGVLAFYEDVGPGSYDAYTRLESGTAGLTISTSSTGATPWIAANITGFVCAMDDAPTGLTAGVRLLGGTSGSEVFSVKAKEADDDVIFMMLGSDSTNHRIRFRNDSSLYDMRGVTLQMCVVGTETDAVQGALRINGNDLECYLNGGWQVAASG